MSCVGDVGLFREEEGERVCRASEEEAGLEGLEGHFQEWVGCGKTGERDVYEAKKVRREMAMKYN
jgi:hypothetical protein